MTGTLLYEDDDVACLMVPQEDTSRAVITFTTRLPRAMPGPWRLENAFGYEMLKKRGLFAFHVMPKWNHWWQTDSMARVLALVRHHLPPQSRRWTYGASMGGTAALKFAGELGAGEAISYYPQATVDPVTAAFDPRWAADRKVLTNFDDRWLGAPHSTKYWLFYDPKFELDARHVELISRAPGPSSLIPVAFAEHSLMRMMKECGVLSNVVSDIVDGTFDPAAMQRMIRSRRASSPVALTGAANQMRNRNKPGMAQALSQQAVNLLESDKKLGLDIDTATATLTMISHATNLVRARNASGAAAFLHMLRHSPVVAFDSRRHQLQLALLARDRAAVVELVDSLLTSDGVTRGLVNSVISAIRSRLFEATDTAFIHSRWGEKFKQSPDAKEYLKEIAAFQESSSDKPFTIEGDALVTRDGVAFLIGGSHSVLKYASGELTPSAASFRNFNANIAHRIAVADAARLPYAHVIFPDKQSVMTEAFPFQPVHRLGDAYLAKAQPECLSRILYPADNLRRMGQAAFHKLDTHLGDHGSLETLRLMLDRAGIDAKSGVERVASRICKPKRWSGDLGSKFSVKLHQEGLALDPDWRFHHLRSPGGFNDGMADILFSPEAERNETLLLFGDSFFRMMLTHLSAVFSTVVCLRTRFLHEEMITLVKPDVMFTGNAERYLSDVSSDSDAHAFALYPELRNLPRPREDAQFLRAWNAVTAPRSKQARELFASYGLAPRPGL